MALLATLLTTLRTRLGDDTERGGFEIASSMAIAAFAIVAAAAIFVLLEGLGGQVVEYMGDLIMG